MQFINKLNQQNTLLCNKLSQYSSRYNDNWSSITKEERQDISSYLLKEQNQCCAYCGIVININNKKEYHIEHLIRRTDNKKLTFTYENLYISCMPSASDNCGKYKDDLFIKDQNNKNKYKTILSAVQNMLRPDNKIYSEIFQVTYHSNKIILKDMDNLYNDIIKQQAKTTIDIFNLNSKNLQIERYQIIDRYKNIIKRLRATQNITINDLRDNHDCNLEQDNNICPELEQIITVFLTCNK